MALVITSTAVAEVSDMVTRPSKGPQRPIGYLGEAQRTVKERLIAGNVAQINDGAARPVSS